MLRVRFGLNFLMILVACIAGIFGGLRTWWTWQFSDFNRDTRVYVRLPDDTVRTVECGALERRLFGRRVNSEQLVSLVRDRNESMKGKEANLHSEPTKEEWKVMYAARILADVRHPKAYTLLIDLLNDPWEHMRRAAANALGDLGDKRALPHLRESVRNATDKTEREVFAFYLGKLGDLDTALPILIDCIDDDWPDNGGLVQIEELTGIPLTDKKAEWSRTRLDGRQYDEFISWLPEFRKSMHEWWNEHKQLATGDDHE